MHYNETNEKPYVWSGTFAVLKDAPAWVGKVIDEEWPGSIDAGRDGGIPWVAVTWAAKETQA